MFRIKSVKFGIDYQLLKMRMPKQVFTYWAVILLFAGCEEKRPITDNDKVNRWIYGVMEANYLWAYFMPEQWQEWTHLNPYNFYPRLIYNPHEDIDLNDLYSRILFTGTDDDYNLYDNGPEYAVETPAYHYGLAVRLIGDSFCHVMYVLPGSPADKAGIRRGDSFMKANGEPIKSLTQFEQMMEEDRIEIEFYYPEEKTVTMVKSFYYDNPVYLDTIYDLSPKTGYFVYNHFTDGGNDRYYNELRQVFARFHAEGVENIIADLRFNGGGELSAARKVSSLLAPFSSLGGVYLYKERKGSYGNPDAFEPESLYGAAQMQGYNCDPQSLYIITNKNTASASELVIHCMRSLYDAEGLKFVHAGEVTEGKNLGGVWFSNDNYQWEIYAITLRVHNIDKVSGYESGLVPDISVKEYDELNYAVSDSGAPYAPLGQLGDIAEEPMLRRVIEDIYGIGGWQELIPPAGQGASGAVSRSMPATVRAGAQRDATTVRYRPLTE